MVGAVLDGLGSYEWEVGWTDWDIQGKNFRV